MQHMLSPVLLFQSPENFDTPQLLDIQLFFVSRTRAILKSLSQNSLIVINRN
jgi:hypothetical protein